MSNSRTPHGYPSVTITQSDPCFKFLSTVWCLLYLDMPEDDPPLRHLTFGKDTLVGGISVVVHKMLEETNDRRIGKLGQDIDYGLRCSHLTVEQIIIATDVLHEISEIYDR
ncbi:Hypothetical protein D9617_16g014910 [Elsinoe fawcettii]|nr:Hypothetical protein D9617_16g014910 [Elsinoe fawcettii]